MNIGASLMAAGAGIVAPLLGAISHFNSAGDALGKMAARTGESASSLAELQFAAEQSGASIEEIEKAIRKQEKEGFTETFDQTAAKIAAIEDPAERTRMAMEAWGKSGTMLRRW